jgi:hypothetical protein
MAELYLKGCEDYRALSKIDRLRFSNLLQTYVYSIEMLNQLASEQAIDTGLTGHPLERLQWLFRQPGVRDWWGQNSGLFGSAFVDTVESVVAGIPHDE